MPLKMNPNQTDKYYILSDEPLESTESLAVVSADPNTVLLSPDAVVVPAPAAVLAAAALIDPTLVVTIGSGGVAIGPAPVLKSPIECSATVTDSAGGAVPAPMEDTCEFDPLIPTKIGVLFDVPTP